VRYWAFACILFVCTNFPEVLLIEIDGFFSFTIAILLLLSGKVLTLKVEILRRYSVPEPVVGGIACAAFVSVVYFVCGCEIRFALDARDFLLLVFFAGIGLKSDVRTLRKGGHSLAILVLLAASFLILQNLTGMGVATFFGQDPRTGLMTGSISLTGGVGTTLAWSPYFVETLGIGNALELGVASNTVGLIAACLIGGPIATFLIRRHRILASGDVQLDIGVRYDDPAPRLDYFSVLWAMLALNVVVTLGMLLDRAIAASGFTLPTFVSCLITGILVRNATPRMVSTALHSQWPGIQQGLSLIGDIALGVFLTMALMGLQLWTLSGYLSFILSVLALQILLTVVFTVLIVFRAMGSDYEAAVISASFGGISLGSTATAIANMTAVTQVHGAAHKAFVIVPLVGGFFIDLINAVVVSVMVGFS
jgi:ESS family glutamate:Na+ symporter